MAALRSIRLGDGRPAATSNGRRIRTRAASRDTAAAIVMREPRDSDRRDHQEHEGGSQSTAKGSHGPTLPRESREACRRSCTSYARSIADDLRSRFSASRSENTPKIDHVAANDVTGGAPRVRGRAAIARCGAPAAPALGILPLNLCSANRGPAEDQRETREEQRQQVIAGAEPPGGEIGTGVEKGLQR